MSRPNGVRVLNVTAHIVEAGPRARLITHVEDEVEFRVDGRSIWRTPAWWHRNDETGMGYAIDAFASRLSAVLNREE